MDTGESPCLKQGHGHRFWLPHQLWDFGQVCPPLRRGNGVVEARTLGHKGLGTW